MPKSRAQFTPMRTTAADSRTKIVITIDTMCRPDPLFDKQTVLEQRIWPTNGVKRNNNLSSAIGRCGAHRRKLRTTFWHVFISRYDGERQK
jgi:hypothetical protein